ncbi:MAG: universal stress protein [Candidatus Bathyarchaeota archaeon]|nr:universal stress protein [Candidatus Bathyarchaeota archaeon]
MKKNLIGKILVALDGSESADRALDFALDLAEKYSANMVLLSVVPFATVPLVPSPPASMQPATPIAVETYSKALREKHEEMLSEAVKKAKKVKPSLNVTTQLVEGRPSDRIIETAEKGDFDLIVIGSRGLGGIKKLFLGSVSDRVADEAKCPVLIVK